MTDQPDISAKRKPLLSYRCYGYDFMWIDKQGKWHTAYPNVPAHKECKSELRAMVEIEAPRLADIPRIPGSSVMYKIVSPAKYAPCECPCHHNWNPQYATHVSDNRKPEIEEELIDA